MDSYRVFISYSHDNKADVELLAAVLKENGLTPVYDAHLPGGFDFNEILKRYIEHSHVFMPLITSQSAERGWVHQEIGYAMAMNIPVLPVTRENLPPAMIQRLHAVSLENDLSNAREKLAYSVFASLVENCPIENTLYYCTTLPEERANMMADMADDVRLMGFSGVLRQRGGLSSFQIPNKPISDRVWMDRYDMVEKNSYHCKCQLAERKALEAHARAAGCRLVINPGIITDNNNHYSSTAQRARLSTLLHFLRSMAPDRMDVAIDQRMTFQESVTIVGDWFSAESSNRSHTQGFMQTMFTRYAPALRSKIETFDSEFETLLQENGYKQGESVPAVIEIIENILSGIV